MSKKKEFSHWVEVEEADGKKVRYSIFRKGQSLYVRNDKDYEHLMHPSATSIENEIQIVFKAKVIRTIMPSENQ